MKKRKSKQSLIPYKESFLLPLSALAFVLLASIGFTSFSPQLSVKLDTPPVSLSPLPEADGALAPQISALSSLVLDEASGVVLFEKNPDLPLPPASTTKMVTALVVLENMPLSQVIDVPQMDIEPQIMKLVTGERITVSDLLFGTLVWSANDAAEALARAFPGGRENFISIMNRRAKELGMVNSNFTNPSGLSHGNHYSSVRDLAQFTKVVMSNFEFASIVGTRDITVKSADGKVAHRLVNLNELLGKVPGVMGVKTGWTEEGRGALVTYVARDNHPMVVVVLGSEDRFGDSEKLIEWAYSSHSWNKTISRNTGR